MHVGVSISPLERLARNIADISSDRYRVVSFSLTISFGSFLFIRSGWFGDVLVLLTPASATIFFVYFV